MAGSPAQAAEIKAGDILVVDSLAGTTAGDERGLGVLFLVDPTTGKRTVLSDFGNPAQGRLSGGGGGSLRSVVLGQGGQILVTDLFGGPLFEVDAATGNRSILSDFAQGNIQGDLDYGLAVDASGKVLADLFLGSHHSGVVRVDPKTDARVLVTDLSNPAQGETVSGVITDLTLDHSGNILIGVEKQTDTEQVPLGIVQVNPETGMRRLLSDFGNPVQGADVLELIVSTGLAVEASGQILVNSGQSPRNLLMRIDPTTGNRAVLSDFDNSAQGDVGSQLHGIGVEKSGGIIVAAVHDPFTNDTFLYRVNPITGRRALLSDSDNAAQGPSFSAGGVVYIAVVQEACVGDCGGTDSVAINDLITLVNIALGTAQPSACAHGVPSGAEVNIALIIQAVNNALNGCPAPTPTATPITTPTPTITATVARTTSPTLSATHTPTHAATTTATPARTGTGTPTSTTTPTQMTGPRFADNGDGTITDAKTRLMWEKKDDAGGIHDKDNTYSWSSTGTADGTAFTTFLPTLNTPPCFAGHCDWRLPTCGGDADRPTGEAPELESLLDASGCSSGTLCVAAAFNTNCGTNSGGNAGCTVDGAGGTQRCSCTQSATHWSATSFAPVPGSYAWTVDFAKGAFGPVLPVGPLDGTFFVRAVRGGL